MFKKSLVLSLALATALSASDLRFELGSASGDGKLKTADIVLNTGSSQSGFTTKTRLGYAKHDNGNAYRVDAVFGWQFGDANSWGLFKIYPIGVGYTYYSSKDNFFVSYNGSSYGYVSDNLSMFTYKAGIEYQKDSLFLDKLSLLVGAFYTHTFYTTNIDEGNDNYYSDLNYKPKGFETYVGVDYGVTDKFIVGAKVGYNKFKDSSFLDESFFNHSGATFKLSVGYKF
ncbi:hypothetical protein [Campylobacter sp. 19-13652]|uniref:hypothetical protein n=1 Tax=Campylobacter sp. 19-13652 TaxID=2840180 RepID=UPI001C75C727|nr:hypothetical protein [Campylobacter sp. 19-13652]BCX79841.1 hypothetical protein LBC_13030 [Campylobacter sp. 19-13652]